MLQTLHSTENERPSTPPTTLDPLKTELGDQAHMLQYLPYDKADFSDQDDEPDAVPLKLLYGQLKSSAKEHAFILLYPAPKYTTSPGTKVFIYDSNNSLKEQIPAIDIGKLATPDAAFDGLVQQHKVLAVAKFYFMTRGVDLKFPVPVSKTFKESILAACMIVKKTKDEAATGALPLRAKHRMVKSEQPRLFPTSAVLFRSYQHVRDARHKALSEKLFGSDEEDGSASMDTTIATQAMVAKIPVSYSPEEYQELRESMVKTPVAEETLPANSVDCSPDTVVGRIQMKNPRNILDSKTQTAAPKMQVPDNPPPHHQFFNPALDLRKHVSDTRTCNSKIPTESPEKQVSPQSPRSRQISAVHRQPISELVPPTNLTAHLRQFRSSKVALRTRSAQHEKDVESAAENRKALEVKKAALKKDEDSLTLSESALQKQEIRLLDEMKRSQQEAKRLMEFMPQEVREWLEFVVEDERERKRQKIG